ncbi:MAG TPA: hypothetical protein VL354_10765 [Spirochaetia bacterium]|nr:hypothetical protein [Spirochaetia bacterium]
MRLIPWKELVAGRERVPEPVRLTIGVFDGLHVGHRKLMEAIIRGPGNAKGLVVTFARSPAQIISPSGFPGLILSYRQKLSRLSRLGVDVVVVIDFSDEMSNLSGRAFIGLLKDNLKIEKIVVGEDFRFGRGREAGSGDLKEMLVDTGIEVQVSQPVLRENAVVSSSRIRKTIQEADFAEARAMLRADYSVDLDGIAGSSQGSRVTVYERARIEQVLPRPGRYKVWCEHAGRQSAGEVEVREDSIVLTLDCPDPATTVIFH